MSNDRYLPYGRQTIDDDDIAAVVEVLRRPLITQGPTVERFERALGAYVGSAYASAVSSGTAALHLAYASLGLGPGDELITTPVTFVATAAAAVQLGATVRFADIDPHTGNIDSRSVAALVNERTRGVAAVHLGGAPADLRALRSLCDRHGLWLVEDASHALGATYRNTRIGSCAYSDATVFSFHPVKHITTGEGGAVTTLRPDVKRTVDRLRHHAVVRNPADMLEDCPGPWYYEVHELGYNYRITDLQCGLGLSQLAKQPGWIERRRAIAERYRLRLAERFGSLVVGQRVADHSESAYHLFVALLELDAFGVDRAAVIRGLHDRGVGSQVHYIPVCDQPFYRGNAGQNTQSGNGRPSDSLPGVREYYRRALSLPMYPGLTDDDVDRVVDALASALGVELRRHRVAA